MGPAIPSLEGFAGMLGKHKKGGSMLHAMSVHAHICRNMLTDGKTLLWLAFGHFLHTGNGFDQLSDGKPSITSKRSPESLPKRAGQQWISCNSGFNSHKIDDDLSLLSRQDFISALKECSLSKDLERGCKLHTKILTLGLLDGDIFLANTLIRTYAKCGFLLKAKGVFDELPSRDVVVWTTLMTGYAEQGYPEDALDCIEYMRQDNISPDEFTLVIGLKTCSILGSIIKGEEMHSEIIKKGYLKENVYIGSTLVDMYVKCGLLSAAIEVFKKLPSHDVALWNALLTGYVEQDLSEEALKCLEWMHNDGISPNTVTLVCILKSCSHSKKLEVGRKIHLEVTRKGFEENILVTSTLVDMYAKSGKLVDAHQLFNNIRVRDVVLWNVLISGYADHGYGGEALDCCEEMIANGVALDSVTFLCSIRSCALLGAFAKGQELHGDIIKKGIDCEMHIGGALVDMYIKFGLPYEAKHVFEKLTVQDVVSCTALIAGYAEHGSNEEALDCYRLAYQVGISLNDVSFGYTLKVCGNLGSMSKGQVVHADLVKKGLESESLVGATLVDMYAKCGFIAEAQHSFNKLPSRGAATWNALIAGYAQYGESEKVFIFYNKMVKECMEPGDIAFLNVLNACTHAGVIDKTWIYLFATANNNCDFIPTVEHYNCMVDFLGRSGNMDEAILMIESVPLQPDVALWHTLLAACWKNNYIRLGQYAFEQSVQLDEQDAASYVCVSNMYADSAMEEEEQILKDKRTNHSYK